MDHSRLVQDEIIEAGSIAVNQIVYDKKRNNEDVIVLSLGESFFDFPQYEIDSARFAAGCHYMDSQGLPGLRKKIANYYSDLHNVLVDPEKHIMITSGSKAIVVMGILATINPGDEVLIQEPFWLSYPEQIKLAHGVSRAVPYYESLLNIEKYFSKKTKLVILNNPNNPSGKVLAREELEKVYEICQKHGAFLLVDEAYSDFCYETKFYSCGNLDRDLNGIIICNSLSKNMGISGWRIGYSISHEKTTRYMLTLNQHINTCAPAILQMYAEDHFDEILSKTLPNAQSVVKLRSRIAKVMDELRLRRLEGDGTFYFFVDIKESGVSSNFFATELLLRHNVAVVPGCFYGNNTDCFVRVGVGTETEERITLALQKMRALIDRLATEHLPTKSLRSEATLSQ